MKQLDEMVRLKCTSNFMPYSFHGMGPSSETSQENMTKWQHGFAVHFLNKFREEVEKRYFGNVIEKCAIVIKQSKTQQQCVRRLKTYAAKIFNEYVLLQCSAKPNSLRLAISLSTPYS